MSQFGADRFTTRSREAIETAQLTATSAGHSATEPIHLLVALLSQEDGVARSLVTKAGVDAAALVAGLRDRGARAAEEVADEEALATRLAEEVRAGDLVVCLGAGTITAWANALPEQLAS